VLEPLVSFSEAFPSAIARKRLEAFAGIVLGTMLVALSHEGVEFLFLSGVAEVHSSSPKENTDCHAGAK
jgi:hypothetical protein